MNLLLLLLGVAFAEVFTGFLEEVDSGTDFDDDSYVLERKVDGISVFYDLVGDEGAPLPQSIQTDISANELLGKPVKIHGEVDEEEMHIEVHGIEADKDSEVRVGSGVTTLGTVTALVVRVTGGGNQPKRDKMDISNMVFGTLGDRLNLNIFEKCSFGKFKVVAFSDSGKGISDGVIDIDIGYDPKGHKDSKVKDDALKAIKLKYGTDNLCDHTMLYFPHGTLRRGSDQWLAYAYVPGWLGVYNGEWMAATTTVAHELGHNLYLKHANENGQEYGDRAGIMGFGEMNLDGPDMCFIGPNNWQLGWYDDRRTIYRSGDGSKVFKVVGIADYDKIAKDANDVVIIKVGKHTYVSLNRKSGVNSQTREFPDMVLIHTWQGLGKMSWMVQTLSTPGQSYKCDDGSDMVITLTKMDLGGSPPNAMIRITSTGPQNTAKWLQVPGEELKGCAIVSNGLCVEVATYDNHEKCYIEAASDGQLQFDPNKPFELPKNEWQFDKLYIGSTQVKVAGDLPSTIKNGDILTWTTDNTQNGDGWKLCMSPTGGDNVDLCKSVTCPAPKACEANVFCFGGECQSTPKEEGEQCDDGNAKTVEDKCNANGVCQGVDKCAGVTCEARHECESAGQCNINTGECDRQPANAGNPCNDGLSHTINDKCDDKGQCKGTLDPTQALWEKKWGNCRAEGKCITTDYNANEDCKFTTRARGSLAFEGGFAIEVGYDELMVDSKNVKQASDLPAVIEKDREVTFKSDGSVQKGAWTLCLGEAPPPPAPPAPGSLNEFQKGFYSLGMAAGGKVDCALSKAAQDYATYMAENSHFNWDYPQKPFLSDRVGSSSFISQRLTAGSGSASYSKVFNSWQSTVKKYKSFGIGSAAGGSAKNYVVMLAGNEENGDSSCVASLTELEVGDLMEMSRDIPQAYSAVSTPFSSVVNILAAIGVLGLGYAAFQACIKKGAYTPVTPHQEEI